MIEADLSKYKLPKMKRTLSARDDETALVFDIGHFSIKFGYAGESLPRTEFPSIVGVLEKPVVELMEVDGENRTPSDLSHEKTTKEYFFETSSIHCASKNIEIQPFLKDCMIEDWDMFENYFSYIFDKHIKSTSDVYPILMSEPSWNTRDKREKLIEIMFEKFKIPSFFLSKNAVLATYANGRGTGIVIDSGASQTSVVPVQDGFVVSKGIIKSTMGSDFINMQCAQYFKDNGIEVIPPYMINSKEIVAKGEPAKWTKVPDLPEVSVSWKNYMVKEVIQDFQKFALKVCDTKYEEEIVANMPTVHYQLPNGFNQDFGAERYRIPETLFNQTNTDASDSPMKLAEMITKSVLKCDSDIRSVMYHNVIVTGGNTLIPGFCERLTHDLSEKIPSNMKLKVFYAEESARRFGAWTGGSLLASRDSLRAMFISKSEYDETGKTQVEGKFP